MRQAPAQPVEAPQGALDAVLRLRSMAHVGGEEGAIFTALYAWRRHLPFVVIAHLLVDLPLFLIALGVLPVG